MTEASPEVLSSALIIWTGFGVSAWPSRDQNRVAAVLGNSVALEVLPAVQRLENDFYGSDARYTARNLVEMGQLAKEHFLLRHPEISESAADALAWCYTFDFK